MSGRSSDVPGREENLDLSHMAMLMDGPEAFVARHPASQPMPVVERMTRGDSTAEGTPESNDGDCSVGGVRGNVPCGSMPIPVVIKQQPLASDESHICGSLPVSKGSVEKSSYESAHSPRDTDWFWNWRTAPPRKSAVPHATSSGSEADARVTSRSRDRQAEVATTQRRRSHSSPSGEHKAATSAKRLSFSPPLSVTVDPNISQPKRLSTEITESHRPQPSGDWTEVEDGHDSAAHPTGVYPPLHATSVPISTPVMVSSNSNTRLNTSPSPALLHSAEAEDTAALGDPGVSPSVFADFAKSRQCFALMPDNSKMVIFDSHLLVKKAFFALVQNGVRSAPVWDSSSQSFIGMLTITDFINILRHYYRSPLVQMHELEEHLIQTWRDLAIRRCHEALVSIDPQQSVYESIRMLIQKKIHRLPVIDHCSSNCLFILTPKRLLQYIYTEFENLAQPDFMSKSISSLNIGTYNNIASVIQDTALIVVLNIFAERRISAVPIIDHNGHVVDVYAKFDVINLAAEKTYNNLDISVKDALKHRAAESRTVHTCLPDESLQTVMRRIVEKQVHRLVVVDVHNHVAGIVSLSDILNFLVLKAPVMFA